MSYTVLGALQILNQLILITIIWRKNYIGTLLQIRILIPERLIDFYDVHSATSYASKAKFKILQASHLESNF